jgi:hypothetical protein
VGWVKIDDCASEHPKLARLSPAGFGLWVAGICYCNRNLTDGYIPDSVARRLLGVDQDVVDGLVVAGAWMLADGGYQVHDYADWQRSREEVLADREKAAERARRHRQRTSTVTPPSRRDSRVSHTTKKKKEKENELSPSGDNHGAVDEVWNAYLEHHPASKLTTGRRDLIGRRLKEHPVDVLVAAVHGNHRSPFHCGENDQGKTYHALELILRDAGKIEGFAELAGETPLDRLSRKRNLSSRDMGELVDMMEGGFGDIQRGITSGGPVAGVLPERADAA